ncbi:MAG TPA: trypsin-like peptidase domain-containing protein, partial [Vicinamibacterales bacterium]|nr:trypsin-like peptidase domain-containing protein [Vicinamibacterales bacterium]
MLSYRLAPICVLSVCLFLGASPAQAQSAKGPGLADLSRSLQDLAAKVSPSVVQIFVVGYAAPDPSDTNATGDPVLERGSGSGVIVSEDGYVVTNAHVVENATRIEVELPFAATGGTPGRSIIGRRGRTLGAQIVAVDEETDLAVLKIDARALPVMPYGDSDSLRPGQIVLAIGSPLGLSSSVTMGVVSAVARQLAPEDPMVYVQTDSAINPGNSGGALIDTEGRLIGINTLILTQSGGNEGIGFAAPSNIVRNVVAQIIKYGRVRRGEIGVHAQTITPVMAEALGFEVDAGVVLSDVAPGSPAAAAGLRAGDLVIGLDGKPMENGRQFRINVYARGAGERVKVDIRRAGKDLSVQVPVVERASGKARLEEVVGSQIVLPKLGVAVLDLTPTVAELLPPLRGKTGAVVVRVAADAPFSQQGRLEAGDVIYAINGKAIGSGADLRAASEGLK